MTTSQAIAKHVREIHFGGNWTASNIKEHLSDVSLDQATQKRNDLNTIAVLQNHMEYYLDIIIRVLEGGPLVGKDEESFEHPVYSSDDEWKQRVKGHLIKAEKLASLIEVLPEQKLHEDFTDPKYGSYYRNLHGFIEHTHYHLGQLVVVKKVLNN